MDVRASCIDHAEGIAISLENVSDWLSLFSILFAGLASQELP